MSTPKDQPAAHFEVEDPAEAFQKLQGAARKVLAVPKKNADAAMAKEKSAKKSDRK